jgi:hypothetical protein
MTSKPLPDHEGLQVQFASGIEVAYKQRNGGCDFRACPF